MVGTAVAIIVALRAVMRRVEKRAMIEVMCLKLLRGFEGSGGGSATASVIAGRTEGVERGAGMIASS